MQLPVAQYSQEGKRSFPNSVNYNRREEERGTLWLIDQKTLKGQGVSHKRPILTNLSNCTVILRVYQTDLMWKTQVSHFSLTHFIHLY
jgi:hypothetical protein